MNNITVKINYKNGKSIVSKYHSAFYENGKLHTSTMGTGVVFVGARIGTLNITEHMISIEIDGVRVFGR